MQHSHKSLIIVVVICFTILGLVAANNVRKGLQMNGQPRIVAVSDHVLNNSNVASQSEVQIDPTFIADKVTVSAKPATKPPVVYTDGISALAYIAANVETGKVYVERNSAKVLSVASMSKLVTAFAATDILPATTTITITKEETDVPPDGSGIYEGETYALNELLYPLLLNSSNIAAEALASTTNRRNYMELMKSYAWEIGMDTAYFADPSGVDPHNQASAKDLVELAKYLYKFRPDVLALTRNVSFSVGTTTEHGSHIFKSTHPFVTDPNFIGGKTGRTPEAGDTMMTIMKIDGAPVAIIVLGSKYDGRAEDTRKIIELVKAKNGGR